MKELQYNKLLVRQTKAYCSRRQKVVEIKFISLEQKN